MALVNVIRLALLSDAISTPIYAQETESTLSTVVSDAVLSGQALES